MLLKKLENKRETNIFLDGIFHIKISNDLNASFPFVNWFQFNLLNCYKDKENICVCVCMYMYMCAFVSCFFVFCFQLCLCLFKRGIVETHIVEKGWEKLSSTIITEMCHNYIPFCIISLCISLLCIFDVGWFNTNTCFTTKLKFCNSQDPANSLQYSYFYSSL